ncbi:MAG: GreA/GreB family elongation factor [Chthoniobacterales bacterium]
MHEELEKAVSSTNLTQKTAEALDRLQPKTYCLHKSWGFGRVAEWNLLTGQIFVDFKGKKAHAMQLQYAADTLHPVPNDHLLAQAAENPEGLKTTLKNDPVGVVRQILQDAGGKATADQINDLMVPAIFDAAAFKKWWEVAKKKLKADGHFAIPAKKTDPIILREEAMDRTSEIFETFGKSKQLKQQINTLEQVLKHLDAFENAQEKLREVTGEMQDSARKNQKLHPPEAIEILLGLSEIGARYPQAIPTAGISISDILRTEEPRLADVFSKLPASKQRRVLTELVAAFQDSWDIRAHRLMRLGNARLVSEIVRLFEEQNRIDEVSSSLERMISERSTTTEILFWFCKERGAQFKPLFRPDVFGAILHALEHDQIEGVNRSSRLHDLVMEDRELIADLLGAAEEEVVQNSMRKLLLTPVFEELNKRSLIARIIKLHPSMQSMIGSEEGEKKESLMVSWPSLERKKNEYENLVNQLIPQNTRDIAIARSYGDLRENLEFKSAKEMQSILLRRKGEIELMLSLSRGTNFENPDTSHVSIGTSVSIQDVNGGETETYHILGAWDSSPEHHVVSYLASIGQTMLGKALGDVVEIPTDTGKRNVRITAIEAFTNLALLGAVAEVAE